MQLRLYSVRAIFSVSRRFRSLLLRTATVTALFSDEPLPVAYKVLSSWDWGAAPWAGDAVAKVPIVCWAAVMPSAEELKGEGDRASHLM